MPKFLKKAKVHDPYYTKDGTRVPGATTILYLVNKPALIHWAWDLGQRGIDYRTHRDILADVGSLVHDMILCHFKKKKCDTSEYSKAQIDMADKSMLSFYAWERTNRVVPIIVEEKLVSERFRFGGKPDLLAKVNGKVSLIDFKTGLRLYEDIFYQLAAYGLLVKETKGTKIEEYVGVNVGRSDSEKFAISARKREDIAQDEMVFLAYLSIYNLKKEIKRKANG